MENLQIADTLKDFIVNQLLEDELTLELDLDTPLFELKILDSLAVVTVVNFIASEFNVQVPLEQLTADNLRSLASMGQMVLRLGAGVATA
jgi:acyl carrier protein